MKYFHDILDVTLVLSWYPFFFARHFKSWRKTYVLPPLSTYPLCDIDEATTGWLKEGGATMRDSRESKVLKWNLKLYIPFANIFNFLDETFKRRFQFVTKLSLSLEPETIKQKTHSTKSKLTGWTQSIRRW